MLALQLLPAACGDCLWLEYGTPPNTHIVIIDGGLRATAAGLRARIDKSREARKVTKLDVELLVVTHIDNDHIVGIIELLESSRDVLNVRDIWFNGRNQLARLPPRPKLAGSRKRPADLMGEVDDPSSESTITPADLLGAVQGDQLSSCLGRYGLPWNADQLWKGGPVHIPDIGNGSMPTLTLSGDLTLTVLGPTLDRLYNLCTVWSDILGGDEDRHLGGGHAQPRDMLGRKDSWPPKWKEGEDKDPSHTNGSSIALLAEYEGHSLLLAADAHASDLEEALIRLAKERDTPLPLTLSAFKLSHHGSDKNLTAALMKTMSCSRYLISTDGSTHRHPDHQALLRILRYSRQKPELIFNYSADTTRPWGTNRQAVLNQGFQDYAAEYSKTPADGVVIRFQPAT